MPNEKLKSAIIGIGALCETWMLTYNNFIKMGVNAKDALAHTREFMTAFMAASMHNKGGNENEKS